MMKNLFQYSLSLMFVLFTLTISAKEVEKVIEESFPISRGGTLDVANKYGDITLIKWDKNEVHIEVIIKADASSTSKGEEQIERVNIDFSGNSSRVSASTSIEDKSSWFNWGNIFGGGSSKLEINYIIHAPQNLDLELTNKYGDIHLPNYDGRATIKLGYGNLFASNLSKKLELDMKYSKATFGDLTDIELEMGYSHFKAISVGEAGVVLKYGSFRVERIDLLDIDVKYSKIFVENANELVGEGGYNDYNIGSVGNVKLIAKYTDTKITSIGDDSVFDLSYGNIRIDNLPKSSATVDIESKYTGIRINEHGPYVIDYEGKYTGLDRPSGLVVNEDIKDGNSRSIRGYKGSNAGPKLKVRSGYGEFKMR